MDNRIFEFATYPTRGEDKVGDEAIIIMFKNMYNIKPSKKNFITHKVTDNHILTLKIRLHKSIRRNKEKFYIEWFDRDIFKYRKKTGFKLVFWGCRKFNLQN